MPPKGSKKAKPADSRTEEECQVEQEARRLRQRAEGNLLQAKHHAPTDNDRIPPQFRKCDGVDILKRNSSRKKKYLFMFPGAVSFPPGVKVGALTGLDTRTPVLYVDYLPHGRLKFKGSLVFPSNSVISVKGSQSKKRPVHVVDSFETLVVFSEWTWIGNEKSNPGEIPMPVPGFLKRKKEDAPELWQTESGAAQQYRKQSKRNDGGKARPSMSSDEIIVDDDASVDVEEVDSLSDPPISLDDEDDDSETWGKGLGSTIGGNAPAPRVNPTRRRRKVNYSQLFDDEDENDDESNSNDSDVKKSRDASSSGNGDNVLSDIIDVD